VYYKSKAEDSKLFYRVLAFDVVKY